MEKGTIRLRALTFDDFLVWELVKTDTRLGSRRAESKQLFDLVGWARDSVGRRHGAVLVLVGRQAEEAAERS